MTTTEARELRATVAGCLEPLYAGRVGTVPSPEAVERAIKRLHALDSLLLTRLYEAQTTEAA